MSPNGDKSLNGAKLLILTHNFPATTKTSRDAGTFVLSTAVSLSRAGYKVWVLMPDVPEEKETYKEICVRWFPWKGEKKLGKLKFYKPKDILSLASLIRRGRDEAIKIAREENIEYCIAFWAVPSGYFAYRVRKKLDIPYCVWILGADIWAYSRVFIFRYIMKKVIKSAHRVFSNSLYLKGEVKRMFNRDAELLYASRILPLDTPEARINKDIINFLFIGRYEKVKGLDVLLKAFRMLVNEKKGVYLYVFGGGELKDNYIKMVNDMELEAYVSINDFASSDVAVSFLKSCNCLIIPSRRESQPVLLMDAIQTKIPVIVTRAGDMEDIVKRFDIGRVVDIEDETGLKDAMTNFIAEGKDRYRQNLENASKKLDISSIPRALIEEIKL